MEEACHLLCKPNHKPSKTFTSQKNLIGSAARGQKVDFSLLLIT